MEIIKTTIKELFEKQQRAIDIKEKIAKLNTELTTIESELVEYGTGEKVTFPFRSFGGQNLLNQGVLYHVKTASPAMVSYKK